MVSNESQTTRLKMDLQSNYLKASISGSGRRADEVLTRAFDQHLTVNEIYLEIFQVTGYTIGKLWQTNQISVAQEHLVTAIIERQMGELHPLFKAKTVKPQTLVIGSVDKENHRVGARMVADFFEQDGWTVHYLGAAVPTNTFLAMAREMQADLVGLSSEMIFHLPAVTDFVRQADSFGLSGIPIMVGGMPFVQQPELYTILGVHFSGIDARAAVDKENTSMVAIPTPNVSGPAQAAFKKNHDKIIAGTVARLLAEPGQFDHLGEQAESTLRSGFEFTTSSLEACMLINDASLLIDQLRWSKDRLPHDGISMNRMAENLRVYCEVIRELLPAPISTEIVNLVAHMMSAQIEIMKSEPDD
jgi:methanogenic corrinoid protein MtbC1